MTDIPEMGTFTRRRVLQIAGGGALALGLGGPISALARPGKPHHHHHRRLRRPDSVPFPKQPVGEFTDALPFDHLIVLMMENHSFDCYFGMLPRRGQPNADGFTFDSNGRPSNRNPYKDGYAVPYRATSECQGSVTQSWNSTHKQIDGGRMDGFAETDAQSMVYWTDEDLPFYYSLAKTFTLANRWFSSAPCQTYPNRRFLMAGTAYGNISTSTSSLQDPPPPNGTIFDRLSGHDISWRNYFTDLPATGIIPATIKKYPAHLAPIGNFFADCASGKLPAVSFVDPEFGAAGEVGGPISNLPLPALPHVPGLPSDPGGFIGAQGGSEENPQNIQIGQAFCAKVIDAVLSSPAWHRTLLVWTYDEHGGYYDHVPPPPAIKPDSIPPKLGPNDIPGGYDIYGPRVPTVVVSPYSRPGGVSEKVFDHTSVLATIEHQWNLPACTYRDANARTVADLLDRHRRPRLLDPPALAAASNPALSETSCSTDQPPLVVQH